MTMGVTFTNLTWDDLCDLMCGFPEEEMEEEQWEEEQVKQAVVEAVEQSQTFR